MSFTTDEVTGRSRTAPDKTFKSKEKTSLLKFEIRATNKAQEEIARVKYL